LLGVYVLPSALTATVLAPNDVAIIIAGVGGAYVFVLAFLVLGAFQARRSSRQDASRPNP